MNPSLQRPVLETVVHSADTLGEGPVWDERSGTLYWTDILGERIHRFQPSSTEHKTQALGVKVGALGLREQEGLIMATQRGFMLLEDDTLTPLVDPEAHLSATRFNDGAVDPLGHFWAGTMEGDNGTLYRLNAAHECQAVDEGFGVPNGIGWSLDFKTMYFTDSSTRTIYAYDFDPATGEVENRRPFIVTEGDSSPDGLTVDAEDFIWSARWDGWCLERYDPAGRLERVLRMPVARPTSIAFGGENLDELYVTSARTGISPDDLAKQPLAGALLRLQPGVQGRPDFRYKG